MYLFVFLTYEKYPGWIAWSANTAGNAPALGMVHSLTTNTNTNANVFRYGDAGSLALRDYKVFSMIRQPAGNQLGFGKCMSFRYFYVLGASVDSVKNTLLQENLLAETLDTAYTPMAANVPFLYYQFAQSQPTSAITANYDLGPDGLLLRTLPFQNSYPLFLITAANGSQHLTSDPYHYSSVAYDGATQSMELLGFLDNATEVYIQNDTICEGDSYNFPDGTSIAAVNASMSHISSFTGLASGMDSLIFGIPIVLFWELQR